ncbi:50S ribosomal protein L23 [Candidatus Woesearchaeota archaeon]|nr:50S ribosomal protein L23 [Candidatus Woesearchaeota archaeon]MBI2130917.1 50S ribosomal protein L23 [Candidatus Woesearchaeota archaeon]MBI2660975.1 50S ribosomal protein L23 [Candidatus Woesearchaeota archaeon]
MDPYAIIKHPLSTEKSIRLMNDQNKLIFVIDKKADKKDVKKAVEEMFKAKVSGVKTVNTKGQKRAYVRFSPETPAIDIATQLGFM